MELSESQIAVPLLMARAQGTRLPASLQCVPTQQKTLCLVPKRFLLAREESHLKEAWVMGGESAITECTDTRQTTTLKGQVPPPLWKSKVRSLSLAPTDLRKSPVHTQQIHKFTVK